ncbi:metallophosphatase domain-containing protein [Alistipes onderdonkii]|uniref:metallophosphatase domain-containing protein n=1 Tax=Alistipes onderdonkii TaxID=328813 RepID=UPI00050A26AA|nr:metallophosphatase domain-containing protein [Alistipes onderdonkii]
MTIAFLSDTHGKHCELKNLPQADMLIHAGDLSWNGTKEEIADFIEWFGTLNYRHKIFIAGNHDDCLDGAGIEGMPHDCYYLCNGGIEIEGVKIWGIPFFLSDEIHWADLYPEKIARIPQQTDILVSHCPPFGILDKSAFGANMGNEDLRKQVEIINPRYHLFGHIHEAYGVYKTSRTTFVNGAVVNENYEPVNHPVVITI